MPVSHRAYGLYGQVTLETVHDRADRIDRTGFFASEQKFRTVRLTVEIVGGDRTRPYALTVSGRSYGFYGQLLRLIKAGLDRGGFISSSAFEGSTSLRCQQRRNSRGLAVTVRIDRGDRSLCVILTSESD